MLFRVENEECAEVKLARTTSPMHQCQGNDMTTEQKAVGNLQIGEELLQEFSDFARLRGFTADELGQVVIKETLRAIRAKGLPPKLSLVINSPQLNP